MVKNKRELKSPRKNRSFIGSRASARLRQNVSNIQAAGNINVVIRVRPLHEKENTNNNRNVIKILDEHTVIFDPKEDDDPFFYRNVPQKNRDVMKRANKNLNFTFDHVFGDDSTNEIVFKSSAKSLIENLMKGYNCSVFVYGATGAGKTHTMLGCEQDPGITFLTLKELFQQKETLQNEREFEIGMTYLEVYNETVQDLLNPGIPLSLREDGKYGVLVAGIKMHRIEQSNTVFELLEQGNRNRTQHPTDANTESSRSHAVFQVYIKMKVKATNEISMSKLSMIDLAGSERGAGTGYSGARFTEGANINKSLLALGNCINSLADERRHVPYRDSKLTRLLKDSLGGNCQTVMIANISPSAFNYEDTYNTLKYAMRAKKIKATMKKNIITSESSINYYMQLAEQLTKENKELKLQLALFENGCNCKTVSVERTKIEEINLVLESSKENLYLQTGLQKLYDNKKHLEHRILLLENAKELAALKKQLKAETQSTISETCTATTRKNQCKTHLDQQSLIIQEDITELKQRNEFIETQIQEILDQTPQLKLKCDVQNAEILCMKINNKADHLQKICDLQTGELRLRFQIIECFSEVLQQCFLKLEDHGLVTDFFNTKYQGVIRNLQGICTISWDDDSVKSNSSTKSTTIKQKDELRSSKRKLSKSASRSNTFVVAEKKASGYNENLKTQVFEIPFDENDGIVMDASYVIIPANEDVLGNEVFTDLETFSNEEIAQSSIYNDCAEDMIFKVSKAVTPNIKTLPLTIGTHLRAPSKTVTTKRLPANVYTPRSPRFVNSNTMPHQIRKENNKPCLRYHSTKFLDKNKLKPISARSNISTTSTSSYTNKL